MEPKPGAKKLPKWFWPVGIALAVIIGLYLRNRANQQSSQNQQQTQPLQQNPYYGTYPDTSNPYAYTPSSPYDLSSLLGNSGLAGGFDPTSFNEGIQYEQGQLGLGNLVPAGSAPTPTPNGSQGPAAINITVTPSPQISGKTKASGRNPGKSNPPVKGAKWFPSNPGNSWRGVGRGWWVKK